MAQLTALYQMGAQGGGFEAGVRLALQKILVSPDFIFRAEYDPAGANPGSVNRITDLELASRLSFFMWSSIPDDELLAVAESGKLSDKSVMAAQMAHAQGSALERAGEKLHRPVSVLAQHRADLARPGASDLR
jgi:hypothetical protein